MERDILYQYAIIGGGRPRPLLLFCLTIEPVLFFGDFFFRALGLVFSMKRKGTKKVTDRSFNLGCFFLFFFILDIFFGAW